MVHAAPRPNGNHYSGVRLPLLSVSCADLMWVSIEERRLRRFNVFQKPTESIQRTGTLTNGGYGTTEDGAQTNVYCMLVDEMDLLHDNVEHTPLA